MPVARSDDGASRPLPPTARKRPLPRKPMDSPHYHREREPVGPAAPPPPLPRPGAPTGSRLDDLYRLPMPKLFALAEKEGIAEHTGMSRGQLIVGIVRKQIERGEQVVG